MKRTVPIVLIAVGALVLTGAVVVAVYGVSSGNSHRPDAKTLGALRATKVRFEGEKRYFGDAWMEKRDGSYVLHLNGSPYATGYQHGALLREEIDKGAVRFYADVINGGRKVPFSLKTWILRKFLDWKVYVPLEKSQPREILEELKGIADGSGLPYDIVFRANHNTGPSMVLTPVLAMNTIAAFEKLGIEIKTGACSTFAATGENTAGGKTIVGRNTDYGAVALWPKYQTILFVSPTEGYAHVKIGTAGVILWNPGMNSEGIVVCPHYMIYEDIDPHGWCIPAFTDAVLRNAGSLEEAEHIFSDNPRGVCAGYVVISGKEKDAFAAELSAGTATLRGMLDERIVMTNMAVSEEKRAMDITAKYNIMEHCPGRYRRLMQLIDANRGEIDPAKAAEFMGDHIQYTTGLERATGHIVGVSDNENSMVFSPEDLAFWVAAGPAPVCNNPYRGFSLPDELKGSPSGVNPPVLRGYAIKNERIRSGLDKFMRAFALKEGNPDDTDGIMAFLEAARAKDPLEPHYGKLLAKYYLRSARYDEALAVMEKVLPLQQSFREEGSGWLLTGMILDMKGERRQALDWYRRIEEMARQKQDDPWFATNRLLQAYAEKYTRSPFTVKDLGDMAANIEFVDPYME
jgi:tetratricopeptide (TPR) repeat protein